MDYLRIVYNGWEIRLVELHVEGKLASFDQVDDGRVVDVCGHEPGECDGSFACSLRDEVIRTEHARALFNALIIE